MTAPFVWANGFSRSQFVAMKSIGSYSLPHFFGRKRICSPFWQPVISKSCTRHTRASAETVARRRAESATPESMGFMTERERRALRPKKVRREHTYAGPNNRIRDVANSTKRRFRRQYIDSKNDTEILGRRSVVEKKGCPLRRTVLRRSANFENKRGRRLGEPLIVIGGGVGRLFFFFQRVA